MKLQELQDFISDFHRVSLAELQICFQTNGENLKPMLDQLINKGNIQKSPMDEKCQTCLKCGSDELEFYEWIGTI